MVKTFGHTIKSVNEGLKKGEFSVEEIRKEYLKKIEKENPKLNAYLSVFDLQKLETENGSTVLSPSVVSLGMNRSPSKD